VVVERLWERIDGVAVATTDGKGWAGELE
jgi:hypothetical protein